MTTAIDVPPSPTRPTAVDATTELGRALRAAGIRASPSPAVDRRRQYVDLGQVTPETALELAKLLHSQMKRTHQVVEDLKVVFRAHGLDMPNPVVYARKIRLGDVSVETADRLACLLGAPPQPHSHLAMTEWSRGQIVLDRLRDAFKAATQGGFLNALFHPDCLRCDKKAAISLGSITVKSARRLVNALQFGDRP